MNAKISFFGIVVKDMAESLAFYRLLGLDLPASADSQPHVQVELPGGLLLVWDTEETITSYDSSWTAPEGSPRIAIAFELPSPADVDKAYDELVAAGHHGHKAPWDAFWGQRYSDVHDPDGNSVCLFAPLPE